MVIDVLRQVLTAQNLASFSLVDCTQSILGQTLEVRARAVTLHTWPPSAWWSAPSPSWAKL